jgi:hypothetical protein
MQEVSKSGGNTVGARIKVQIGAGDLLLIARGRSTAGFRRSDQRLSEVQAWSCFIPWREGKTTAESLCV